MPHLFRLFIFLVIIFFFPKRNLWAAPQGARVLHGNVSINTTGPRTTIVAGDQSIINYQSFNIATTETVQFIQPTTSSRVFNRVIGADPTHIDGALLGNGQVYLVNSAGIFFGPNSIVDVGGLFAVAGSLSNSDFLDKINNFTELQGTVRNEGSLTAKAVHLIGHRVENVGSIVATEGLVTLAAGDEVFIGESGSQIFVKLSGTKEEGVGVDNQGTVEAKKGAVQLSAGDIYSVAIRNSGTIKAPEVQITAEDKATVEVTGFVSSPGGLVKVVSDKIHLFDALIDLSSDSGGGDLYIGQDSERVETASYTFIDADTDLKSDAIILGNGGNIIIWGDRWTRFDGKASALGGSEAGDGGFIEISAREDLYFNGSADLRADNGRWGTLLFDPATITITDGGGGADDGDLPDLSNATVGTGGGFTISETSLEALATNADLILEATGDITLNNLSDNDLALPMNNGGSVTITADSDGSGAGDFIMSDTGDTISTQGASITISAETITAGSFDTSAPGGGARDVTLTAADTITLEDISSEAINLTAADGIDLNGTITATNGVTIDADSNSDGTGTLDIDDAVDTNNTALTLTAADYTLGGSIDSGTATTTFNVTNNRSVGIGNSPSEDTNFNGTFINSITAQNLTFSTGGDVVVGNVSTGNTNGITGTMTITSTGGTVDFTGGNSGFNPALTVNADSTITVDSQITAGGNTNFTSTNGGADINSNIDTSNGNFNLTADDFDLDASASIDAGTGDITLTANGGIDIALTGAGGESNPFDINNATLSRLTSDDLTIAAQGAGDISVDGVTAGATTNIGDLVTLSAVNGDITFENNASTIDNRLTVTTRSDIIINENLTTTDTTTLTADSNDSGAGDLSISAAVDTGSNALTITAATMDLSSGTIDAGTALTTITASANGDIGLGSATVGLDLTNTELANITSQTLTFSTTGGGDIYVDAVSAAATANISSTLTLAPNDDLIFQNGASTFTNDVTTNPGGQNTISTDVSITTGTLTFNQDSVLTADVTITDSGGGGINFNDEIDSDGTARDLTITAAGPVLLGDDIGSASPLDSITISPGGTTNISSSTITTTGDQTYNDAIILDTDVTMVGDTFTFDSTIDSDATERDLTITSTDTVIFNDVVGQTSNQLDVLTVTAANAMDLDVDMTGNTLSYQAGSDGTGDLTFSAGVDLLATTIALRAGDGAGGTNTAVVDAVTNTPTFRDTAGGATSPTNFTIRQDAAIDDSDMPATTELGAGPSGVNITLDSDDADVTLDDNADRVQDSNLVLEGGTGVINFNVALTLASLDVTGDANLEQDITTTGLMIFNDNVVLEDDVTLDGGTITFSGTVDSDSVGTPRSLDLDSSGTVTFADDVGVTAPLNTVDTDAGGTTAINGDNFLTTGNQTFNDAITLGSANSVLIDSSGGSVNAVSTITKANGDLTISGDSGIDLDDDVTLSAGSLTISEDLTIAGDITASADITFDGTVTLDDGGNQAIDATAGTLTINDTLTQASGDLTLGGGTAIDINADITITSGALTVEDDFTLDSNLTAGADITLSRDGTLDGAIDQTIDAGTGTLLASGDLTKTATGELTLSGDSLIDLEGDIDQQGGDITLTDPTDAEGDITATGSATFDDTLLLAGDLSATDITLSASLTLDGGNQSVDAGTGTLTAEDITKTTAGTLTLGGDTLIDLNDDLEVQNGALTIDDNVDSVGDITAVGITLNGTTTLSDSTDQQIEAGTGTLQSNGAITKTGSGDLTLLGDTAIDLNDDVDIDGGDLILSNDFTAAGDLIASNDLTISTVGVLDGTTAQRIDAESGTLQIDTALTSTNSNTLTFGGGTAIDINADITSSSGSITIEDDFTASGDLTADQNLTLSGDATLDGVGDQTLEATNGTATAQSIVKSSSGDVEIIAGSGINLNGSEYTISDDFTVTGDVDLGSDTTITTTDLTFTGTIDGSNNLILDASGTSTFQGDIGIVTPLGSGDGPSLHVFSTGDTTFEGEVSVTGSIVQDDGAGLLAFEDDILILSDSASTIFNSDISFTSISTTFEGPLTIGNSTSDILTINNEDLSFDTSQNNQDIIINSQIQGIEDLTLLAGDGDITINGALGTDNMLVDFIATGENVIINNKVDATGDITITSDVDILIDGDIDPLTITLTAGDDIDIMMPLLADNTITITAGTDGTGNINLLSGGSVTTTNAGSTISLLTGSTSGNITLNGNITALSTITLNTPAGNITRSGGTLTASTIDLDAFSGIGSATNALFLAGSSISADATSGIINLNNTTASNATLTSWTTTDGALTFNQSGGGNITIDDADTSSGSISVTNTGGDIIILPTLSTGEIDTNNSGNVTLTTVTSGDIYIGFIEVLHHQLTVDAADNIQDAQDDLSLDLSAKSLILTAGGGIGGLSLVGNVVDSDGHVEIYAPLFSSTAVITPTFIIDLTPLYLRSLQDPSPFAYHSKHPYKLKMVKKEISTNLFTIGKAIYKGTPSLVREEVELVRSSPIKKTFLSADTLLLPHAELSPRLQVKSLKDLVELELSWQEIRGVLTKAVHHHLRKKKEPFSFSIFIRELENNGDQETLTVIHNLQKLGKAIETLGFEKEQKKLFEEELKQLTKPSKLPSEAWKFFIQ